MSKGDGKAGRLREKASGNAFAVGALGVGAYLWWRSRGDGGGGGACDGVTCGPGEECQDGQCVVVNPCVDVSCGPNEACVDGECVALDPCADVSCPDGQVCDAGNCVDAPVDNPCADVSCGPGEVCDGNTGECVVVDPCATVECADHEECANGECVPISGPVDVEFQITCPLETGVNYTLVVNDQPSRAGSGDMAAESNNDTIRDLGNGNWLIDGFVGTNPDFPLQGDTFRWTGNMPPEFGIVGFNADIPDGDYTIQINGLTVDPSTLPALGLERNVLEIESDIEVAAWFTSEAGTAVVPHDAGNNTTAVGDPDLQWDFWGDGTTTVDTVVRPGDGDAFEVFGGGLIGLNHGPEGTPRFYWNGQEITPADIPIGVSAPRQ